MLNGIEGDYTIATSDTAKKKECMGLSLSEILLQLTQKVEKSMVQQMGLYICKKLVSCECPVNEIHLSFVRKTSLHKLASKGLSLLQHLFVHTLTKNREISFFKA